MSGHTPGPWTVHGDSANGALEIKSSSQDVARVFGGAVRPSEMAKLPSIRRANARLIAAAPEMYEALKAVLAEDDYCRCVACDMARAALAKADGGK